MPELSIESVHQLLLEDRKIIKDDVSINDGRNQLLMQNTNAIKELLQIKLFDDEQQFDEDNRQMVDSIALEIRELLFSDASDMMQGAMIGSPIECFAFAKWWIQREKGLKIREDIFSRSPQEEQACESINAELKKGNEAGVLLAEHLIDMGSSKGELNVSVNGKDFKIVIEQLR